MRTDLDIGIVDAFIFLASFQAIYLAFLIIRSSKGNKGNLYQGLFLMMVALIVFDEFLNDTGYILRILFLHSYTQPLNLMLPPLFYLYIKYSLAPNTKQKDWIHCIYPSFYLLYSCFYFAQPEAIKYNDYISNKRPDWAPLNVACTFSQDPIGLREYSNQIVMLIALAYDTVSFLIIYRKFKELGVSFWSRRPEKLASIRNSFLHVMLIAIFFIALKCTFGMKSDVGMLIMVYFGIYVFWISSNIISRSPILSREFSILDYNGFKYQKSSLTEEQKDEILQQIRHEMADNHYFSSNLSSLAGLAKQIQRSPHHVSQVINERLNQSFYEMLAAYRIEYAKGLMKDDKSGSLTIEEIAEKSGYNAKSSFNTAFKKQMKVTPSEYRKKIREGSSALN